jgi:hypothetical protein
LAGDGPASRGAAAALTIATSVELLEGEMYYSPPIFTPPLPERYRLAR